MNSRGQVVLDSSKGENKLGFYVENYLLKMNSGELDNLFDDRGANLVNEPPVGMFEEWNRVLILKGMIYRKSKSDEDKDLNGVNQG